MAAAVMVALLGPLAGSALAHATLLETTPGNDAMLERAPEEVLLRFDEGVDTFEGSVRVLDRDGERVDRGRVVRREGGAVIAAAVDAGGTGTHTVVWRVVGSDGHDRSGSFIFHVGSRTGAAPIDMGSQRSVDVLAVIARWLALLGSLTTVGGALVASAVSSSGAVRARLRTAVAIAATTAAAAVVALLFTQAAAASGRSLADALGVTWDLTVGTRTGVLTLLRLGALAAAAALAVLAPAWRRAPWAPAVAGAVALVATSATGHAWTAERRSLAVGADVVHLGAAAMWVGGLVAVAAVWRHTADQEGVMKRFSAAAVIAAAAVLVTGAISGFEQVGSLTALLDTAYGRLLLVKLAGFAGLVWLGWENRRVYLPRFADTASSLIRNVRLEIGIATVVVAVTAVVVGQAPAKATYSRPYEGTTSVADLTVQVQVDPSRTGANDIHMYFFDDRGAAANVDAVELTAAIGDIPPRRLDVTPIAPSHVSAYGAALTSPGTWTFQATIVRAGTPRTVSFEVPIK